MNEGLFDRIARGMAEHGDSARASLALVKSWHSGALVAVAGCGTLQRIAYGMTFGHGVERMAAREYLYRWSLALQWASPRSNLGATYAPHTLGM